jgi:hypothetical protein
LQARSLSQQPAICEVRVVQKTSTILSHDFRERSSEGQPEARLDAS